MKNKSNLRKVFSLMFKLQPGLFPSILMFHCIQGSLIFINLIFSSRILDMIIARQTLEEIMKQVFLLVGINLVLVLSHHAFEKIAIVKKRLLNVQIYQMICKKTLGIDYEVLEKKDTLEMIQRAEEGMKSHGDTGAFCDSLGWLIEGISCIVYSTVLMVGLFLPVDMENPTLLERFLNSGLSFLLLIMVMIFCLIIMVCLRNWMKKNEKIHFTHNVKLNRSFLYYNDFVWDYPQGKYVRLYHMKDMIMQAYKDNISQNEAFSRDLLKKSHMSTVIEHGVLYFFQGCSYLYVGVKATLGMISLGDVLKYVGCLQQFFHSIMRVLHVWIELDMYSHYLSYFYDYMDLKNEKYEGTLPIEKRDDNQFDIEFKDVSFCYPNSEEMVLSHVNIKLTVGSKTAVVGKNGAGKTTFIKLLCRLYDPTEGEILLNGINIKLYDYDEYIRLFGVVFQDFQLFSFSLAENVAASVEYDESKVLACLEKAGFGNRIKDMPQGIHTNIYQLEDDGVEISGGEAQKIAIARALYKDAPFVILDEPTSALDPVSEHEIYQHFNELVEDKTSLYISHRMSSCRFCDRIYVFDEGRIVQEGSHEQLMEDKNGVYCQLWEAQAQYYQKDVS